MALAAVCVTVMGFAIVYRRAALEKQAVDK